MIVIELNKYPSGYYTVQVSKSYNNAPSVKFDVVDTVMRFDTAMSEARIVAKREAVKLKNKGKFYAAGQWHKITDTRDMWVTIDKYNTTTDKNIVVEQWKWTGTRFIIKPINKILR
jgi:hypothetical protein